MKTTQQMRNQVILLAMLIATAVAVAPASSGKVAFILNNEIFAANEEGSGAKALTADKIPKQGLAWAPGGDRIAYRIAGSHTKNPKTHGNIVVVSPENSATSIAPVLMTEADGSIVDGMRFIEDSGWYSEAAVFASGSANPHVSEYRIIDLASRSVKTSYFGFDFATCSRKAKVAYGVEEQGDPKSSKFHIEVNGNAIYSTSDEGGIRSLHWSESCDRLAFLEGEGTHIKLVVLNNTKIEAKIDLRGAAGEQSIKVFQNQFFLPEYLGGASYDPTSHLVKPALPLVEQIKKQKAARESVMERLGGHSAVWWEPAH
jgi:hypothetical protein